MFELTGTVQAIHNKLFHHVNVISYENLQRDRPIDELAFIEAEIAYDAGQEERAIYYGMTEQEFIDAPEWQVEQEPPCPHRFTEFDALECWSGNCYQAAKELLDVIAPERHPERQHPNGGWRGELVNLWHLILHWLR